MIYFSDIENIIVHTIFVSSHEMTSKFFLHHLWWILQLDVWQTLASAVTTATEQQQQQQQSRD